MVIVVPVVVVAVAVVVVSMVVAPAVVNIVLLGCMALVACSSGSSSRLLLQLQLVMFGDSVVEALLS